jgi:site-specific recombinase XerD
MSGSLVTLSAEFSSWPIAIATAEPRARFAILEFFAASISNPHTRRAYIRAAHEFFVFAAPLGGGNRLASITSLHVAAWLENMKARGLSAPTVKLRLAALRMLFEALLRGQIIAVDPTAAVRGPRYSVTRGKTPVLDGAEVEHLLRSIDVSTLAGLRDRAVIATMAYSFARISAVTALRVGDVFKQKQRLWLRLAEKGGKAMDVPCHHRLEEVLATWLDSSALGGTPDAPLFQSFRWEDNDDKYEIGSADACAVDYTGDNDQPSARRRILSGRKLTQSVTWNMIQRRTRAAGLTTVVCNHTFRAAGITAYLANGGTIERAAHIAGHASTRTTQLYDRRPDDVTLDEIEKIRFA